MMYELQTRKIIPRAVRIETSREPPFLDAAPWKRTGEVLVETGEAEETLLNILV